jgi:hypothetical protein
MADETQNLNLTITAQDTGASTILVDVRSHIVAIEQELRSMSTASQGFGQNLASGAQVGAAGVAQVTKAVSDVKTPLEDVAGRTATLAKGFEAGGIAAAGAASRIAGLAGAFELLHTAAPEILAIIAVITALRESVGFLVASVEDAASSQQSLMRMKGIIQETGGSFSAVAPQAQQFVEALSAVGVTADQGYASLNHLMEAGASFHDASSELAVGAQMVAAGIGDWSTVTDALTKAQGVAGDMMLTKLVPGIKEMVHEGSSLGQIMEYIRQRTQDSIASDDSLSGANARLHAEWVALGEIIGQEMLPYLTYLIKGFIGVVIGLQDLAEAQELWARGTVASFKEVGDTGESFFTEIGKLIRDFVADLKGSVSDLGAAYDALKGGHIGDALDDIGKAESSFNNLHGGTVKATESTRDFDAAWTKLRQGLGDIFHPQVAAAEKLASAMKEIAALAKGVNSLDNNPWSKEPQKGSQSSGYTPPVIADAIQSNKLEAQAQEENAQVSDRLADAKDAAEQAEARLNVAMKLTTSSASEQAAQNELNKQKVADLTGQLGILNPAIAQEQQMLVADNAAKVTAGQQYESLRQHLISVTTALAGQKNISEGTKEAVDQLRGAVDAAKTRYDDASSSVKSLTSEIRTHREEVAKDSAAITDLANTSAYVAAEMARKWGDYYAKEQADLKEFLDTFRLTNEQKVEYYAEAAAQINGIDHDSEQLRESYLQKYIEAVKATAQQELEAAKQVLDEEKQAVQTTLDDILTEHKSFSDELKSIFDSILKNYVSMLSEMVVKSNWFQGIAHTFGAPTLPGATTQAPASDAQLQQASQALQSAASQGSQAATQTSQAATQTGQAATQTGQSATQMSQAATQLDEAASRLGSIVSGGTSDATDSNNPLATLSWVANVSQGTYSSPFYVAESPGGASETLQSILAAPGGAYSAIAATNPYDQVAQIESQATAEEANVPVSGVSAAGKGLGGALSGALEGYGIGDMISGLTGENQTWGGVGGAVLGGVGGALFGPVGSAIGGLVGGLLGGLFGNHEQPWQEPDINQPGYGQFVSNMIGTYGTYNGQYVAAQSPYNVAQGGTPEGKDVFNELAALPKNLSPALAGLASQLKALERGDTNDNALEIKSEYQGMFTLESGAVVSVQKYMQLIDEFMKEAPNVIQAFTLTRTYPNLDISHLRRNAQGDEVAGGGSTSSGTSGPNVGLGGLAARTTGPLIHLDLSGASITGPGGLQAIIAELESLLQRAQQGQVVGTFANAFSSNIKYPWPS